MHIESATVQRITIVDDDPAMRDSYEESMRDLGVESHKASGPLADLVEFATLAMNASQAAVCDFKLNVKNYAAFDGAELVAHWFDYGFPALLCTKWDRANEDEIRRFRAKIPVLLKPNELDAKVIVDGLRACLREIHGLPSSGRKTYRTLVRVEAVDEERQSAFLVVPAWKSNEVVRVPLSYLPQPTRERLSVDTRLYAEVNLGAESNEDLFFAKWLES